MKYISWMVAAGVIVGSMPFAGRALAAPVPSDPNLVLWMRADQGVTGTSLVTKIEDSSDNDNDMFSGGNPKLATLTFPTGDHPVIHFGGAAALWVPNTTALNLQNASIYMVASEQFGFFTRQCFIANYGPAFVGYAVGISDSTPNTVKFYTSHGSFQSSQEPITVPDETPFLLTTTFTSTGSKNLYYNSGPAYHEDGAYPSYAPSNQFSIGGLDADGTNGPGGENFNQDIIGDIAEILIFDNVDEAQRADVESYLFAKYFLTGSADFNSDGKVDGADFLIYQRGFGKTGASLADGDANGDSVVDADDLKVFKAMFGAASTAVGSAVPEPCTFTLAAGGLLFALETARTYRRSGSRRSL